MKTLNELRASKLITIISKEIELEYEELIDLSVKASKFEIQPNKAKKLYGEIINRAAIDTHRIFLLANKYFNHSGELPKEVEGAKIYGLSYFSDLMRFFEL